jgi:hypothetical protein
MRPTCSVVIARLDYCSVLCVVFLSVYLVLYEITDLFLLEIKNIL